MNKIVRMAIFLLVSFSIIGIFLIVTLHLLSLLINSEIDMFGKVIIMAVAVFISTKFIYPAFILGYFINAVPKNLMFPKSYLPYAILFCLIMTAYFIESYSYLLKENLSFFSLRSLLIGFFIMTAYRILSPLIYFYYNTIKTRKDLTNVEIRYCIYEDQENLVRNPKHQIFSIASREIDVYWAKEFEKANLEY